MNGKRSTGKKSSKNAISQEFSDGYFVRGLEAQIKRYSTQTSRQGPGSDLALRLFELLAAEESGTVLDDQQLVPEMPEELHTAHSGRRTQSRAFQQRKTKSVHVRSRNGRTLRKGHRMSASARRRIGRAQRARWKKYHAEQRAAIRLEQKAA